MQSTLTTSTQAPTPKHLRWREWSLQLQLVMVVTFIGLGVVTGITLAFIVRQNQTLRSQLEERALTTLVSIDGAIIDEIYFVNVDQIEATVRSFADTTELLLIRVYDANGRLLTATDNRALGASLNSDPYAVTLLEADGPQLEWRSDRLVAGQRIAVGNEALGVLHIELSTANLSNQLQIGLLQGFVSAILVSLFGVIAVIYVSRSLTQPIGTLVRQTGAIANGDLTKPISVQGGSFEIAELTRTIEEMRSNLHKSYAELEHRVVETEAARQRAEQSDKVKSSFLASMSHELRTPLNAIINFTKFVAKGQMGPVTEEQQETLGEVVDSAKHLLSLINDVLDMSKIESGTLTLFVTDNVDLRSILNQVVTTGKSLIDDKPVEIRAEIADDLPRIRGDRQRLTQMFLNIVSNACKFTEAGSISVRAQQQADNVVIAITDTGMGIAAEDQPIVFEAFKQTESGLRQGGGTGLGMPITKNLVEAHGGKIQLESQVGVGTTFTVMLPVTSTLEPTLSKTRNFS